MNQSKYNDRRLEAIQAAAAVFASKGFHGASTADIAAEMGMKQGSLYYYFKSKEEALEEVCLLGIDDYVRHMHDIARGEKSFDARLFAVVSNHLNSYRDSHDALRVHNNERHYLPESRRGRLKQLGSDYRASLEEILERAQAAGDLRADLDCHFAALAIIGMCNSMGELLEREPDLDLFALVQKCTDLLQYGLLSRA